MSGAKTSAKRRAGSGVLPVLCNLLGTLILLAVILTYLPLSAPRLIGVTAYHVESGSMAPELPQGSAAFVRAAEATEIEPGDVIAFRTDDAVVLHRVSCSNQLLSCPMEKAIATHSSTLAWKIPWTEEPERLQSMGS